MTMTRNRSPLGGGRTSNPKPSGTTNGTMGGQTRQTTAKMSMGMKGGVSDPTFYLWLLVLLEVLVMGYFRHHMRRYHGG